MFRLWTDYVRPRHRDRSHFVHCLVGDVCGDQQAWARPGSWSGGACAIAVTWACLRLRSKWSAIMFRTLLPASTLTSPPWHDHTLLRYTGYTSGRLNWR